MGGFPKIKQRLLTPRRYYSEWRKEISRISLPVEILGDSVPFGQVFDSIKCLPATRRDSLEIPLSESFSLRGISLPESRSRLYQGSRSRSDNFVCKSTPPLFQTPQPRIDEIDISPLPLTSDRRGWGFPPLEIDFFTPRLDFLPPFTPDRLRLILPPLPRKWHIGSEKFRSISLVFPRPPGPAWDLDFGSRQLYLLGVGGWVSKN